MRQTREALRDHEWVVHPVEVRLLSRARDSVSSGNRGMDAASWSGGGTMLGFNVSNRLVERGPWCAVLERPRAWPLRALARYTPAGEIAALMDEVRSSPAMAASGEVERLRLLALLGLVGRVRFPGDRRFHSAEEATMTQEALASPEPWGHLQQDEQLDFVKEARRRYDLAMANARREGRAEGRAEGERAALLDLIEVLGGASLARDLAALPLDELRAELMRLASPSNR